MHVRPYRSALYVPGSNARALAKSGSLPVDALLIDLEDAVAPAEKAAARDAVRDMLSANHGSRQRIVRVNGSGTEWGADDLAMVATAQPDGVLIPKVDNASEIDRVTAITGDIPVWAMIETPFGVMNAGEIAAHSRLAGFVLGTNDLAKDLGSRSGNAREPMLYALGAALMAARAHGKVAIDGVFNAFRDDDGFAAECAQGRDMGYDGKSLIHPAQIATANAIFGPSEDDIDLARRQIAAFEEAASAGQGVAVLGGEIVENLHVATAQALLAKAAAIAELER